MKKITKVFIANRGEIALRIVRACKEMGITSVTILHMRRKIMKKLILISATAALLLGGSTLLASAEHADKSSNNQDDLDERYEMPFTSNEDGLYSRDDNYDEQYEKVDDDSVDERYEMSKIYNGKEHYARHGSDDEYDEHF